MGQCFEKHSVWRLPMVILQNFNLLKYVYFCDFFKSQMGCTPYNLPSQIHFSSFVINLGVQIREADSYVQIRKL